MQKILIAIIHGYRYLLSPWLGNHCRFNPSCSQYAVESIKIHGAGRGAWLTACRLLRCQPWYSGGYDPVPPASGTCYRSTHNHG